MAKINIFINNDSFIIHIFSVSYFNVQKINRWKIKCKANEYKNKNNEHIKLCYAWYTDIEKTTKIITNSLVTNISGKRYPIK
jgi:hypothetical protein